MACSLQKKIEAEYFQDGLAEAVFGFWALLAGLASLLAPVEAGLFLLMVLMIALPLLLGRGVGMLKARWTARRAGFVRLKSPSREHFLRRTTLVLTGAAALVFVVAYVNTSTIGDASLMGAILAAGLTWPAVRYKIRRFYPAAGLVLLIGMQLSSPWSSFDREAVRVGWMLAATGGVCLGSGSLMFLRFLRSHPVSPEITQ